MAVRLTIPSVTGPYTNISARLELLSSQIRTEPSLEDSALKDVPPSRTTSVATSTAQGDGGVFEMNFRDARYMPFEGAGAISTWRLSLPRHLRPFDYNTIEDVLLNLSYTAQEDGVYRDEVEGATAAAEGALLQVLESEGLTRLLSFRQEVSSRFHQLTHQPAGTAVNFELTERHFPMFLQGRELTPYSAHVLLRTRDEVDASGVVVDLDGNNVSGFAPSSELGGLMVANAMMSAPLRGSHTLKIVDGSGLEDSDGDLDPRALQDLIVVVQYRVA